MAQAPTIDLTSESPAADRSRPDDDDLHDPRMHETQRQAIMAFARSKLNSGGSSGHEKMDGGSPGVQQERKRLRAGEGGQHPEQETQGQGSAAPDHAHKECPQPPPNSFNDTLSMLRMEREERQRQRQRQQEAQTACSLSGSAAQGAHAPSEAHTLRPQAEGSQKAWTVAAAAENGGPSTSFAVMQGSAASSAAAAQQQLQQQQQQVQQQQQQQQQQQVQQQKRKRGHDEALSHSSPSGTTATLLTYNIWFAPDAMEERMGALGSIIERLQPDIIMLQEVTMDSLEIFSRAGWVSQYTLMPIPECMQYFTLTMVRSDTVRVGTRERVPFKNTIQARDLNIVRAYVKGHPLTFANTHLESPLPFPMSKGYQEREQQLQQSLELLNARCQGSDVIMGGDMNWIGREQPTKLLQDAQFVDLWPVLQPGDPGITYDARTNPMITYPSGNRLDRFFARLGSRWEADSMELVGTEPIPGKTINKEVNKATKARRDLPLMVSDHYGLLLRLRASSVPAGQKLGRREDSDSGSQNGAATVSGGGTAVGGGSVSGRVDVVANGSGGAVRSGGAVVGGGGGASAAGTAGSAGGRAAPGSGGAHKDSEVIVLDD